MFVNILKRTFIFFIIFGLLVICLIMDEFPQTVINHETNLVYAMGPRHRPWPKPNPKPNPNPTSVPEPSTLALIGTGAAGAGIYLILRNRNKKK